MNRTTLVKVWTAVALLAIYFAVNGLLQAQRSPWTLPIPIVSAESATRPAITPVYFSYVAAVLVYMVSLLIASAYVVRFGGSGRATSRFPVFFNLPLLPTDVLARWYQRFWMVWYIGLVPYATLHCLKRTMSTKLMSCGDPVVVHQGRFAWGHSNADWFATYKLGDCNGVDYFGRAWDVVLVLAGLAMVVLWLRLVWLLYKRGSQAAVTMA